MSCNLSHFYVKKCFSQHLFKTFCAVPTLSKLLHIQQQQQIYTNWYKHARTNNYTNYRHKETPRNTTKYMYTYEIYTLYNL